MKVLFEQIKKVIVNCPKTKKRAKLERCKKCDYGFEVRNETHCLYNDPVGTCISSIGISLDDKESYAVELKPEFGIPGMTSIHFPVKDGIIGNPVYASHSEGYYCREEPQQVEPFDPCGEKCDNCPDNCRVDCKLDDKHLNMRVLGRGKKG